MAMDTFQNLKNRVSANKAQSQADYYLQLQNTHIYATIFINDIYQMVYLHIGNSITTYGWRNAQFHLPINWFLITCIKFNFK